MSIVMRLLCLALLLFTAQATASTLTIAANPVDGKQRDAFQRQINLFKQAHPDFKVELKIFEHEDYKSRVTQSLEKGEVLADVLFWFGGASIREFADREWIADLSELWQQEGWHETFSEASRRAVSRAQRQFGLPLYYYQWGLYYRKSLFDQLRLRPPQTLAELEHLSTTLRKNGITPFTLGSKNHWPAAAWFDYLNLRINGLAFHESLLAGCHAFIEPRVDAVLATLSKYIQRGDFIDNPQQHDWKAALPFLYHKQAAMVLMGNFFLASVPNSIRHDIAFAPFPLQQESDPYFEDAPIDILIVPANSQNSPARSAFLRAMARPDTQAQLAASLDMIPPNRDAKISNDATIRQGAYLLNQAQGLAQFFDRDTHPAFSQRALPLLSSLFQSPENYQAVLAELEQARQAVWPERSRNSMACQAGSGDV